MHHTAVSTVTCKDINVQRRLAWVAGAKGTVFVFIACIASVSNRVIARKLEREQQKGGLPRPSFVFALVPTFSTNSRANACDVGYHFQNLQGIWKMVRSFIENSRLCVKKKDFFYKNLTSELGEFYQSCFHSYSILFEFFCKPWWRVNLIHMNVRTTKEVFLGKRLVQGVLMYASLPPPPPPRAITHGLRAGQQVKSNIK